MASRYAAPWRAPSGAPRCTSFTPGRWGNGGCWPWRRCPAPPRRADAIRRLLAIVDVTGAIVTVDAGNASQANAAAVVEREADYLFAIEGNLAAMHAALVSFLDRAEAVDFRGVMGSHQREVARGHGRDEVREVWAVPATAIPTAGRDWPSLNSFVRVDRSGSCQTRR